MSLTSVKWYFLLFLILQTILASDFKKDGKSKHKKLKLNVTGVIHTNSLSKDSLLEQGAHKNAETMNTRKETMSFSQLHKFNKKTVYGKNDDGLIEMNPTKADKRSEDENKKSFDESEYFEKSQGRENEENGDFALDHKIFQKSNTKARVDVSNKNEDPEPEELIYDENFQLAHPWENQKEDDLIHYGIKEILLAHSQGIDGANDITTYFKIICYKMTETFGKEEVIHQQPIKILRVAKLFDQNFEKFIVQDSWGLKKNQIVRLKELDYLQKECANKIPHEKREEKFKVLKKAVLRNLLHYYSKVATEDHKVDAIVQAFVPIIWKKFDPLKWEFEGDCYLPHRQDLVKTHYSFCQGWIKITNVTPNPTAVIMGLQAFFIQVGVPCLMIYYQNWRSPTTRGYLAYGEVMNNLCPEPLTIFPTRSTHLNWYNVGTKTASVILLAFLYINMKVDEVEQMKKFRINWQNLAIPRKGMFASRFTNSMAFGLIILSTVTLFYQQSDFGDLLLNFMAMQFIMSFDEDLEEKRKVKLGIATSNDGGRKLLLSYVANGIRDTNQMNSLLNKTSPLIFAMMNLGMFLIYVWVFYCL